MPENVHCTNEKSSILEKIKEHKKEIIVVSAVVCTTIAGILIYKKLTPKQINALQELAEHSSELNKFPTIQEASSCAILDFPPAKTSTVTGHRRVLPNGHKASQKQIELAKSLGIILAENETYVTEYLRNAA